MTGYPLLLNLEGRRCLVFGGGKVATRKIQALLKRGARITCVSKGFSKSLRGLAKRSGCSLILKGVGVERKRQKGPGPFWTFRRERGRGDHPPTLVIVATSDRDFNARVSRECRKRRILVNVVDDPELCDFTVPAVVQRGPLQIAISTDGTSPLFAKRLREELEKVIPPSTGRLLEKLGRIRRK